MNKKWIMKAMLAVLAVFAPVVPLVICCFALCLLDLVAGLLAAKKRKEAITSAGLRRTISKLVIYEITLLSAFIADSYLTGGMLSLTKIVGSFIAITELKSLAENLDEATGQSVFKALIARLGSQNDKT